MDDFRLIAARRLAWDKEAWRRPGYLALITRSLAPIVNDETESTASRAEARMLMKQLYKAVKEPPLTWTK